MNKYDIATAKDRYKKYLDGLIVDDRSARLTSRSLVSPYARCFAIFGYQLLLEEDWLQSRADVLANEIREDLDIFRKQRMAKSVELRYDKPYMQLLCFSLSALAVCNKLTEDPLADHVIPLVASDVRQDLVRINALNGVPQSGNKAMFLAVILCHATEYLGLNASGQIAAWQDLHLDHVNENGFWGNSNNMSYAEFQNGYHQYEIMEYLGNETIPWDRAANNVAQLADRDARFAPIVGGGGCYDYDAIHFLTHSSTQSNTMFSGIILRTAEEILIEQNDDGGFCESLYVRPRSVNNLIRGFRNVTLSKKGLRKEKGRRWLSSLRMKNDRIKTHWTTYSREWSESNLWDSWFRMLTVARVDVALNSEHMSDWGFISYPGIGFHSRLKNG